MKTKKFYSVIPGMLAAAGRIDICLGLHLLLPVDKLYIWKSAIGQNKFSLGVVHKRCPQSGFADKG